jgi:hypothetical protein
MYREIISVIVTNSEDQNEEDDRFFLWERIFPDFPDLIGNLGPSYIFKLPILSKTQRHMVLVIQPSRKWQEQRDLKLLLSLKNLYVMGFLHANKWLLFSDAEEQHGVSEQEKALWTSKLTFGGGYTRRGLQPDFSKIKLSKAAVMELYKSLVGHGFVSQKESMEALATFAVIGPECIRFPKLRRRFLKLVYSDKCETVDMVGDDKIVEKFSVHIRLWDKHCEKIRGGEAAFEAMTNIGIDTFLELVSFVGVMPWSKVLVSD